MFSSACYEVPLSYEAKAMPANYSQCLEEGIGTYSAVTDSGSAGGTSYEPFNGDGGDSLEDGAATREKDGHGEAWDAPCDEKPRLAFTGRAYAFDEELQRAFPDLKSCDWNALVQWWLTLPTNTRFARDERDRILEKIMLAFVETARPFALQLIDESFLLDGQEGGLKPDLSFGGVAGGKKYRQGSQLFKFAEDVQLPNGAWIYGGTVRNDATARKSASHELKSIQALIDEQIVELGFPLMVLFDYRGKRVSCASILPIKGKASLVQGMSSVHDQILHIPDPTVGSVMDRLGAALYISRGHHGIIGPFDLEIHRVSGQLYLIDAARLFPPEAPRPGDPPSVIFYRLLRPELLKLFGVPLSPDAFLVGDKGPRQAIRDATNFLDEQVANLACFLSQQDETSLLQSLASRDALKRLVHSWGINMRHVMRVAQLTNDRAKAALVAAITKEACPDYCECKVKCLRTPRAFADTDVRRILAVQEKLLTGNSRLQMVPFLLQLSTLSQEPLERKLLDPAEKQWYRPWGSSPLARAFDLCLECDPSFKFSESYRIESCNVVSLGVLLEICLRDKSFAFPHWQDLYHLRTMHLYDSFLAARVEEFLQGRMQADPLESWMDFAAKDTQWDLLLEYGVRYGARRSAALKMAQFGHVLGLWKLWTVEDDLGEVLLAAAQGGQSALVVEIIQARGFDLNYRRHSDGVSALYMACAYSHLEVARFLLEEKADVNSCRNDGRSPLWIACVDGLTPLIELLLSNKADVNARRQDGMTALWIAAQEGHDKVVRLLLAHGADWKLCATDNGRYLAGISPLGIAQEKGKASVISLLISLDSN